LEVFLCDGNVCAKIILWTFVSATLVLPPMLLIFEGFPFTVRESGVLFKSEYADDYHC
jgi:hypothetical protein